MLTIPLLAELGCLIHFLVFLRCLGLQSSGLPLTILYFSKEKHKRGNRT